MKIIAHRGAWNAPKCSQEPNSLKAFTHAVESGFGIEVDIRDYQGKVVVSHNPAQADSPLLSDVLAMYQRLCSTSYIAFNIKADGLQPLLKEQLKHYYIKNYFTFDMSIPNTLADMQSDLNFFLRQSEFELYPQRLGLLYETSKGIWIDQFEESKLVLDHNFSSIASHFKKGKQICWVSPELHPWGQEKNKRLSIWNRLRLTDKQFPANSIYLCTDHPQEAEEYFNEKH